MRVIFTCFTGGGNHRSALLASTNIVHCQNPELILSVGTEIVQYLYHELPSELKEGLKKNNNNKENGILY